MDEQRVYVYPTISQNNWWKLRDLLRKRTPPQISDIYLSQVLDMKPDSARSNVLRALRTLGLVGENDQPTPLVQRWREDSDYPDVCKEMLDATYPPELIDVFPGPPIDREKLRGWFRRNAGANESLANKMAITYALLAEADLEQSSQNEKSPAPTKRASPPKPQPRAATAAAPLPAKEESSAKGSEIEPTDAESRIKLAKELRQPTIHVDVQIHISPETTTEQIESIFANMAKYFNE